MTLQILIDFRVHLRQCLPVEELLDHLKVKDFLDDEDEELVLSMSSRGDKVDKLIDILVYERRNPSVIKYMIDLLRNVMNFEELAHCLEVANTDIIETSLDLERQSHVDKRIQDTFEISRQKLSKYIIAEALLPSLTAKKIISEEEKQKILSKITAFEKVDRLLDCLWLHGTSETYNEFLACLKKEKFPKAVTYLEECRRLSDI